MPLGAALPFALIVLPGFLRGDRERRNGRAVLGVMEIGILTGEADDGELVHIHCLISFELIGGPNVLGHPRSKRPRSQARGVLCWGTDRRPNGDCEATWGSRESRTERGAGRVGLSAAVPRTMATTERLGDGQVHGSCWTRRRPGSRGGIRIGTSRRRAHEREGKIQAHRPPANLHVEMVVLFEDNDRRRDRR